jgi:signal transduction histidine kinase
MPEPGMRSGTRNRQVGLIDHDARLRHQLLGVFQILCLAMVAVTPLAALASSGPLDRRAFIPPAVIASGTLVQHLLWRRHKDRIVSFVLTGSLFLALIAGTLLNGIRAPSTVIPVLSILLGGYLLGREFAWKVGIASLFVLLGGYIAARFGRLPSLVAPVGVWSRVVAIQIAVSAGILALPLRGLLSGVRQIEREKAALEESVDSLERLRKILTKDVARRTRDLELANADLSIFTSVLSHDLDTPLRSIQGATEALGSTPASLTTEQTELLERIRAGSARLEEDLRRAIRNTHADRSA